MDQNSESDALQFVEAIFSGVPARQKAFCLAMFADSINEANIYGRDKWAVTLVRVLGRDKIRLIVGHIIVCTLEDKRIWFALDGELLDTSPRELAQLEGSGDWEWYAEYPKYKQIPARNGFYAPSSNHSTLWPIIRRLHFESIYKAANRTTMDPRSPGGHCPGALKYLRNELGRHIPDPAY